VADEFVRRVSERAQGLRVGDGRDPETEVGPLAGADEVERIEALVREAEAVTVGNGMDPGTDMGPLIDDRQVEVVHRHVSEAAAAGARVLTGGEPADAPGSFYPPTVLTDVDGSMAIMRQETFGPVAPVQVVGSFDEGLELASATEYGLAASVLTPSHENAQRASRELQVGTVKINSVWGGAPGGGAEPRGVSGTGFGYGPELLDELTRMKVIHMEPAPRAEGGAADAR
jgi:succinate-semialdehyde dehydrogenase/glutarate-semialdehyde dehydrogenase